MKRLIVSLLLLVNIACFAQIPDFTNQLVNDYAGLFSAAENQHLENQLRHYYDTTSNCIVVVTTNNLNGYTAADFAQQLGDKWGIGTGNRSNGLVVLLCPDEREIFIATGYGLEGVLPDVVCHRIAEKEMKPHFQNGDYYAGIVAGLDVILPIAAKEFSYDQYQKEQDAREAEENRIAIIVLICTITAVVIFYSIVNYRKKHPSKKQLARQKILASTNRAELDEAVAHAQKIGIRKKQIDKFVNKLIQNKLNAIATAETYRKMVMTMEMARALGADSDAVLAARARTRQQTLARISNPTTQQSVENAIALATTLEVPETEIVAAKERGRQRATEKVAQANSKTEMATAAALALWLGATAAAVAIAKQRANSRWSHQAHFGGFPTNGHFGSGSSGKFGGFGGGRFGGGGGGAKW